MRHTQRGRRKLARTVRRMHRCDVGGALGRGAEGRPAAPRCSPFATPAPAPPPPPAEHCRPKRSQHGPVRPHVPATAAADAEVWGHVISVADDADRRAAAALALAGATKKCASDAEEEQFLVLKRLLHGKGAYAQLLRIKATAIK